MKTPIVARYEWTPEEFLKAQQQFRRQRLRRNSSSCVAVLIGVAAINTVVAVAIPVMLNLPVPGISIVVVVFLGALLLLEGAAFLSRIAIRRQFRRSPELREVVTWEFRPTRLIRSTEYQLAEYSWAAFSRFTATPEGVLLIRGNDNYHWLPRHAFASIDEYEDLIDLAEQCIGKHVPLEPAGGASE